MHYLRLNDVRAYTIAFELSNGVWGAVMTWDFFARDTIGKQFVRSVDSISANIAEGFGRYNKKDKILFYRYAAGSVKESLDWNEKAFRRKVLSLEAYSLFFDALSRLPREINSLIKITASKLQK